MAEIIKTFEVFVGLGKVKVEYDLYCGDMEHFSFYGKGVSETGYRSHFFCKSEMKEGETIEQYAQRVALELNRELQHKK